MTHDRPSIEAEIDAMLDEHERATRRYYQPHFSNRHDDADRARYHAAREALRSRFLEQQKELEEARLFRMTPIDTCITRSDPISAYGVMRCRGHWHVMHCGEALLILGDPFDDINKALDAADELNLEAAAIQPEGTPQK